MLSFCFLLTSLTDMILCTLGISFLAEEALALSTVIAILREIHWPSLLSDVPCSTYYTTNMSVAPEPKCSCSHIGAILVLAHAGTFTGMSS